jgi:hypothetical protein
MKWYAVQRADGRFYADQKDVTVGVGLHWVSTASAGSLYWGHKGEGVVELLRGKGEDVSLVPVEVTVRARSAGKGKPPQPRAKASRSLVCAECGHPVAPGGQGKCGACGSDMVKPA